MDLRKNNQVCLVGWVDQDGLKINHKFYGERFFEFHLGVERTSGYVDLVPVVVSEKLIRSADYAGKPVCVTGQFRSYNRRDGEKRRLELRVFAKTVEILDEEADLDGTNQISLNGYICNMPIFRETPFGREITDLLIAVNRPHGKSDYIPCIAWGRDARFAGILETGTELKIHGRIQSREYIKKLSEEESETRTAYEVSISQMEVIDDAKED